MIFDFNDGWTLTKENGESFSVCLPHDAMLGEKRYASCRNSVQSGYFPGGKYRYTKTFQINESDIGKNIRLHFGGVYRNALVSVNGEAVKENKYGYSPFTADLTEKITIGKNTVEVLADNSLVPNCRWYTGSGIYRPVYLEISKKDAPTFLKIKTVGISPPPLSKLIPTTVRKYRFSMPRAALPPEVKKVGLRLAGRTCGPQKRLTSTPARSQETAKN